MLGSTNRNLIVVSYLQTTVLGARRVPYITFDAIIGRNSKFHGLTKENLEELGGVEYRALNMLLWIIGLVSTREIDALVLNESGMLNFG